MLFHLDPRLNHTKVLASLPVTSDETGFENDLECFRKELYKNATTQKESKLNILKTEFKKLRKTGNIDPTDYEKIIKDLVLRARGENKGQYYDRDQQFSDKCQYALEKILFLANNNPEIKKQVEKLSKNLHVCGTGTETALFNILYILTMKQSFEHWLPQLRYTIVENLASQYIFKRRQVNNNPNGGAAWEKHIGLAFYKFAEQCEFNLPSGKEYAAIKETYKIEQATGLTQNYQHTFRTDFFKEYTYETILKEVYDRYNSLLQEYSIKDNLDTESLRKFNEIIQPFIDANICNLEDVLVWQEEEIENPDGTKILTEKCRVHKNFLVKLADFCEILLYSQRYFNDNPAVSSVATIVKKSYLEKKSKPKKFEKNITPIFCKLEAAEKFERLTINERIELQFFFMEEELKKLRENLSIYQRIKKYWGFNWKTDRQIVLEAQCIKLKNKQFNPLSKEKIEQYNKDNKYLLELKTASLKISKDNKPNKKSNAEKNLNYLNKLIENSEIKLATLAKHKNNLSLIILLDPIYLVASRLNLILSNLSEQSITESFVKLFNKILRSNGEKKGLELTEKILNIHQNISRKYTKDLNFDELLNFPETYFTSFNSYLFDNLPSYWFSPENILLLKKLLTGCSEVNISEKSIVSFLTQEDFLDLTKKILSFKNEIEGIQCVRNIVLKAQNMPSKLNIAVFLELTQNYQKPYLFEKLDISWFSEKNILLLKELLIILKNSSDQENVIINFLASHNPEDFTLFIRKKILLACKKNNPLVEISQEWEHYKSQEIREVNAISDLAKKVQNNRGKLKDCEGLTNIQTLLTSEVSDLSPDIKKSLEISAKYCENKVKQHSSDRYLFWKKNHHEKRKAHYQEALNACNLFVVPGSDRI